jgi:hypothetical protein
MVQNVGGRAWGRQVPHSPRPYPLQAAVANVEVALAAEPSDGALCATLVADVAVQIQGDQSTTVST